MKWSAKHGVWISGAFTVRLEMDPRTSVVLFELYDATRYVKAFLNANEAKQHAENLNGRAQERKAS